MNYNIKEELRERLKELILNINEKLDKTEMVKLNYKYYLKFCNCDCCCQGNSPLLWERGYNYTINGIDEIVHVIGTGYRSCLRMKKIILVLEEFLINKL
ncbi:MAG: hypothetical protein H7836_14160 [Magnetococcus sp. YQC-3]